MGLYALTLMEREGPVHGYLLSESIAQRTDGAWRPGPGSVYPSLQRLVGDGLAVRKVEGRRRTYAISRKGRAFLTKFRSRSQPFQQGRHDAMLLWVEILGSKDAGEFVARRLRWVLESTEAYLASAREGGARLAEVRKHVAAELSLSLDRIEQRGRPRGRTRARGVAYAG